MTAQHSTKGQVHLHETFLVLFVVIILLLLGLLLYSKFFVQSLQTRAATLSERDATVLLTKLTSLAELRCSDKPCLDTSKFLPFQTLTQQRRASYVPFLGTLRITVEEIYPEPLTDAVCTKTLYLQPGYPGSCSQWVLYNQQPKTLTSTQKFSTIVSLYYPETQVYTLGRLHLEVYKP